MPIRLVVLGANGVFGRRVLKRLSPLSQLEIVAVCRTKAQAAGLARIFGERIQTVYGDAGSAAELNTICQGAHALFHCAGPFSAQPLNPLRTALNHGLDYADLGDDLGYLLAAEKLIAEAKPKDRIMVTGASSLPSITSLLASLAQQKYGPVGEIAVHLFIGNQNPKGWGAIQYLIQALRTPFQTLRDGQWVLKKTWGELTTEKSPFSPRKYPYSLIQGPEDCFLPRWFKAQTVSFWVSLELSWIHWAIRGIGLLQRVTPPQLDMFWVNFLFYGHPFIKWMGTLEGHLEVNTTHRTSSGVVACHQRLSAEDDGQRIPTFPLIAIGRVLAGELPRPSGTVTRFMDLLKGEGFLKEIEAEGIRYQSTS